LKIAVLSDVHDHVWNLRAALGAVRDADALVFCGDFCSPFVVPLLAEGFSGPIHAVFGNNDGDLFRIAQNASRFDHVQLHAELFAGELGGRRVAVNHYPEIALGLAAAGRFDLVCYGHNHRFAVEGRGSVLTVNPGTLLGYDPAERRDVPATFALYDAASGQAELFAVGPRGEVAPLA
jgi:putative phosphoesterase